MAPNNSSIDWKEVLTGEVLVFELLGRLLYGEPDKNWLIRLLDEDVFADVPFGAEQQETKIGLELLRAWTEENRKGLTDGSFDDLRVDYTRLFVGVGKVLAPPWESVYFGDDRLLFQEQTLQVRAWYRRLGLEPEKLYQEPDDHIGLELLFLAHLARLGLQALEENDQARFEECLLAQGGFAAEHPLKWVSAWAGSVQANAKTGFYCGLAHLTHGTLLALAEGLEIKMPKEVLL